MPVSNNSIDVVLNRLQKELENVELMKKRPLEAFQNILLLCELLGEFAISPRKAEIILSMLEHMKLNRTDTIRSVLDRLNGKIRLNQDIIKKRLCLERGPYSPERKSPEHTQTSNVLFLFNRK